MRDLELYLSFTREKLVEALGACITDLRSIIDQIGFVKSQELSTKRDVWLSLPDASTQLKDRSAAYAAINYTTQLHELEAAKDCLIEEKYFILRLLDASQK